jgi:dihydrofolate synthase/folylpolyglutamate synthase
MLASKNHEPVLQYLLQPGDAVYFVPVPDHNSANIAELVAIAQRICPGLKSALAFNDVQLALQAATIAAQNRDLVILCGSLYLLGHFFAQEQLSSTH